MCAYFILSPIIRIPFNVHCVSIYFQLSVINTYIFHIRQCWTYSKMLYMCSICKEVSAWIFVRYIYVYIRRLPISYWELLFILPQKNSRSCSLKLFTRWWLCRPLWTSSKIEKVSVFSSFSCWQMCPCAYTIDKCILILSRSIIHGSECKYPTNSMNKCAVMWLHSIYYK